MKFIFKFKINPFPKVLLKNLNSPRLLEFFPNYFSEGSDFVTVIQDFLDYDESVTANPYFGGFLPTESFFSENDEFNRYDNVFETTDIVRNFSFNLCSTIKI